VTGVDLKCCRKLNIKNACLFSKFVHNKKPEKQSGREAKLSREGNCKTMSFKFLVKLRRWLLEKQRLSFGANN
jgi:hypothetical protein